jgi:hypothetical protein
MSEQVFSQGERHEPAAMGTRWRVPIGAVSVGLALLLLAYSAVAFVAVGLLGSGWAWTTAVILIIGTAAFAVPGGFLLSGGVRLLRRRPGADSRHRIFGWVAVALGVTSLYGSLTRGPKAGEIAATVSQAVVLAYAVFALVWFYRPGIRREVSSWGASQR